MQVHFNFLIFFGLLLILSCSTQKEWPKAKKQSLEEVLAGIESAQRDYNWFSAKARIKFEGEEMRLGGRANIRMIKDSLIWMNFKKLSIEGSRALIRQDSFWIVYRLDDLYESGTYQELMEAYDLDLTFRELQDLIVGNYPVAQENEVERFKTKKTHQLYFSSGQNQYEFSVDGRYQLRDFIIRDIYNRQVIGSYGDYQNDGFAHDKSLELIMEDGTRGSVTLNLSSVEFDIPKSIKFEVPSHYTKLP